MNVRTFAGISLIAVVGIFALTLNAKAAKNPVQASRITFLEPTRVCGHYLMGDYIVVHDDRKMERGEPCTTFYAARPREAAAEAVVSFHCIPRQRAPVSQTTITTIPVGGVTTTTGTLELVEYQIAGDSEVHGVPEFDGHETGR